MCPNPPSWRPAQISQDVVKVSLIRLGNPENANASASQAIKSVFEMTTVETMPLSDWPVGKVVGQFLDY